MGDDIILTAGSDDPKEPVTKCNERFAINSAARKLVDDCDKVTEADRQELRELARKRARETAEAECKLHKKCNVTQMLSETEKFTEDCDKRMLVISLNVKAVCQEPEEET